MDFKYRIEQAQAKLKDAEQAKTIAETQLKTAKDECDAVIKEMETLGVTPENIEAEIAKLEAEVNDGLTAIEQAIPTIQ